MKAPASCQVSYLVNSILPLDSMTDCIPPNYAQISGEISHVANTIDKARLSGGVRTFLSSGQKKRGEALMDASRIMLHQCGSLMNEAEQATVRDRYDIAKVAKAELDAGGMSWYQEFWKAREFKRVAKRGYQAAKAASDRVLDDNIPRPRDGTDPPAGSPPATPEESDGTDPPATPPEELDRTQPHDLGTDSYATLSPGATGIGGPMDEFHETYSFIYDPDLARTETSIASYKTDRTVNSRKSRYNALPRRKHVDSGHLGITEGIKSLNVDDVSAQGSEVPAARPQPGPSPEPDQSWMSDMAQEADNLSRISIEDLTGADDQRRWE
ncbi:hypothetical protein H4582DRAFT_1982425 [Lactarius indigo]|nr:hypothetical protein H4582DRAFT_1982425 [Lactarius indigo]